MTKPTLAAALKRGGPIYPATYTKADQARFLWLLTLCQDDFACEEFKMGTGWHATPHLSSPHNALRSAGRYRYWHVKTDD